MKQITLGAVQALLVLAVLGPVTLTAAGCTTVRSRDELDPEARWTYTIRELPGRGEQLRGELSFRGRRVPLYFSEIVVGGRRYTAALRTTGDGFQGYREDDAFSPAEIAAVGAELGQAEQTRGWYLSELTERRPGTPEDWIWVRRENLAAYLNPRRLHAFASHYQLADMHEAREPRVQFMFSYGIHSR